MPNSYRYISNSNSYQYISKNAKIDINISSEVHEKSLIFFEKIIVAQNFLINIDIDYLSIFSQISLSTSTLIFSKNFQQRYRYFLKTSLALLISIFPKNFPSDIDIDIFQNCRCISLSIYQTPQAWSQITHSRVLETSQATVYLKLFSIVALNGDILNNYFI